MLEDRYIAMTETAIPIPIGGLIATPKGLAKPSVTSLPNGST